MTTAAASQRVWAVTAFIVTDLCAVIAWVYFFLLNRAEVVRPYRGTDLPNLILVSNHQSPLDSCFIALAAFFPRLLFRPRLHPWNIAASEYWFSHRVIAWLARHLRCLPARAGIRDATAVRRLCRMLPNGMTIFFPEGRRSPDGMVRRGLPGAGVIARATRARIVPVAIDGLLEAMPYHAPRPRIGRRLRIAFGDPVPCEDLFAQPATREAAQAVVDRSMAAVTRLHARLRTDGSATWVTERLQRPAPDMRVR